MADSFKISASLDIPKSISQINADIAKLQSQVNQLKITTEIDITKSLNNIQAKLNSIPSPTIKVNINPVNVDVTSAISNGLKGVQAQANQTANAINNSTDILESFKKSLRNTNMGTSLIDTVAKQIKNLDVQITSLNQSASKISGKSGSKSILSVDITGIDKMGQAVKLTQQYDLESQKLIKTIRNVASATQQSNSQLDSLMAKQIKRRADLKNQVEQIYKSAIDPNASRSITSQNHINNLKNQYDSVIVSIERMNGTSKTAFANQEAEVIKLISVLKSMVSQYRNAENVSTTLKPDKLASAISKAESQFTILNTDIANAGVTSDKLTNNLNIINNILNKSKNGSIINRAEIEQVYSALRNAKNELTALIKMKVSGSAIEQVRIQATTLVNELNTFANNNKGFNNFTQTINGTVVSVESLKQALANVNSKSDLSIIRSQADALKSSFKSSITDVTKYVTEVNKAIVKLNSLQNSSAFAKNASNTQVVQTKQEISQLISKYQTLMTQLQGNITPSGFENIRNKLIELSNQFIQVTSTAKNFESQLKNNNSADKLAQKVALLTARIEAFKKVNSKSVKNFGSQYDSMLSELRNPNIDEATYNRINKQFQIMRQEIVATDKAGKSLFDLFKDKSKKFLGWMSMTFMYSLAMRTIRSMISDVVELDYALVDLKKTFKGTTSELQDFYYESSNIAKQLGVTSKEVITSASSWSRLGYNTKQTAIEMAKAASIMKMISPNMDIETANNGLISIVKAFQEIDTNQIIDQVISPINEVGNTFAVSNSDILEGLQRSSAAMKMMGEDLTSTIALFTAGKFCCLYVQKCA